MKVFIYSAILIFLATRLSAQEYQQQETDVSQLADELYGQPDEDLNYEELYENLAQLIAHPIDLNRATIEDFNFLNILSDDQIKNLINYRTENGNFLTVYELQAVPALDLSTIHKLIPFVMVKDQHQRMNASVIKRIQEESANYLLVRCERTLQQKSGFQDHVDEASRFQGSPDRLYMRFRSSRPGDFSIGFTTEKDAGEQMRWKPSTRYYGMDYISYHLHLQNKGKLKNLIIGDFQSQFGQGLMLGGAFGMGKGGETITTVRRSNVGLLPYTSVYEVGALRGIGLTVELLKNFSVSGFASKTRKDATIASDETGEIISSFQTTGFHRNEGELSTRKTVIEKNLGGVIQYRRNGLDAGVMLNFTDFGTKVHRTPSAYNQFAFGGRLNRNVGVYVNYSIQNATFFSEVARSLKGGYAGVAGVLLSMSPKLDVALLYRRYDRDFYSFYTSGFAESSNTQNERGMYWGWKYSFNRRYSIMGYIDLFKFPWLRFRNYTPSTGYEWLLRFNYEPSRKTRISIQVREEWKTRNVELDTINQYITAAGKKNNYLVSFDYSPHAMLRLKSRAQLSTYTINGQGTRGLALMQDFILDVGKLKLTMRYGLFETDDYDNRQYAYENDVWLAYSLPAYYGSGVRKMVIIEYKFNKHFSVWLRYAQTRYRDQEYIGASVDRINGNSKEDVKAQLVVRF